MFTFWLGCQGALAPSLVEQPLAGDDVVAVFPPDGAQRMWGDVPVRVVFGAEADPSTLSVTLARDGSELPLPCVLSAGGNLASCGIIPGMEPGETIELDVSVSGSTHRVRTLGELPEPGLGWSLLEGVEFTRFGWGGNAAGTLNRFLGQGSAFAALDGYDGTPGEWTLLVSPSGLDENGSVAVAPWGFGFLLPVTVAWDGTLEGFAHTAWLPVQVGSDAVQLLLFNVRLSGHLEDDRIEDLSLQGVLPALSLAEMADSMNGVVSELVSLVRLDMDLDRDGRADAATITLEGTPAPAVLRAWE